MLYVQRVDDVLLHLVQIILMRTFYCSVSYVPGIHVVICPGGSLGMALGWDTED